MDETKNCECGCCYCDECGDCDINHTAPIEVGTIDIWDWDYAEGYDDGYDDGAGHTKLCAGVAAVIGGVVGALAYKFLHKN